MGGQECPRQPIAAIDACVVPNFWEALAPAARDRYDEALAAVDAQRHQVTRARPQQLERLRSTARRAEKPYRLVDPENRLVASELERRWEQALPALRQAEVEAAGRTGATLEPLAVERRQQWHESHPTLRPWWDEGKRTH